MHGNNTTNARDTKTSKHIVVLDDPKVHTGLRQWMLSASTIFKIDKNVIPELVIFEGDNHDSSSFTINRWEQHQGSVMVDPLLWIMYLLNTASRTPNPAHYPVECRFAQTVHATKVIDERLVVLGKRETMKHECMQIWKKMSDI
jgi:hypothetical protein